MSKIDELVNALSDLEATDTLNNIYAESSDEHAELHRSNLHQYLHDMKARTPNALFVLEAPGYRGCARTGIPITSERIMLNDTPPFGLFAEGYQLHPEKPMGMAESSATIFWGALLEHASEAPLLWNTVPLHPHKPERRASNRTPRVAEQRMGHPYLEMVINMYQPKTILAVGRIAQKACETLKLTYIPLRHPSQGGKADFIAGLTAAQI